MAPKLWNQRLCSTGMVALKSRTGGSKRAGIFMLCVPVWKDGRIVYLSVPLGYRMWQKKESKLELAASMVRQVMPVFASQKNVIILCVVITLVITIMKCKK